MPGNVKSILKQGSDFLKNAGKKKLITIGLVLLAVVVGGIVTAVLLNKTNYTVLYSDLSAAEAGTIMDKLDDMGVDAKVKGTDTILVPEDQADELRIELAADGYPSTGLNYDIFSNSSSLTATDEEELTYKQYQLEENMRTTISKFDKVKDCIVIVNLPVTSSFVVSDDTTEASVSIELELEDGETLTNAEAKSIAKFAETCVPDLALENISIVDTSLNYYDIASDDDSGTVAGSSTEQQELTEQMKDILSDQVKTVIEPAVGSSNLAVSVNVSLDFDSESVDKVEFSPPIEGETKGLLRSSEEIYNAVNGDSTASGEAGSDSNGVSASEYTSTDTSDTTTSSGSYDNTYNYELNQIETQIQKAQGSIQDLSVSVLVNSNVSGISDYVDTIKSLVANAIGVDKEYITVGLLPFVEDAGETNFDDYLQGSEAIAKQYTKAKLIRTGIIAGTALLLGLMALLILGKKKKHGKKEKEEAAEIGQAVDVTAGQPANTETSEKAEEERLLKNLAVGKSNETAKVEELMDKYPEAVAQILRNWLTEDKS